MTTIPPILLSVIGGLLTAGLAFLGSWEQSGNVQGAVMAAILAFLGAMTTAHHVSKIAVGQAAASAPGSK